ncbi:MAG: glycosyltransferase family 4 protein [Gammaproteobacteria bacterium]|nr:glycosyltransferase family 4 protein [Gammaproteobacteria bacterium]
MKVILSIDPIRYPLTGIGRYTYELARGLQQAGLEDLLLMRGMRLQRDLPPRPDLSAEPGATSIAVPRSLRTRLQDMAKKSRLAAGLYGTLAPWQRGRVLAGHEDHIYHGPNFYLPPFAGTSVATIHDLSIYLWPQTHPPERVRYMRSQLKKTLKYADFLITDTEYTRREVASYFNWPLQRIRAVHLASAAEFQPRSPQQLRPILQQLGLQPDGYVLFTGTIEPRKNLELLLQAYQQLPAALRQRWPLVLCGYRGWASADLHRRMESAQRAGWLKSPGFVDASVLPALMAGARLFVYPSLYEGFGLPVLEAMASGVPVICSNASTLPEVVADAAALHAPQDVDGLCRLLQRGREEQHWRARAAAAGLQRASEFSWQRCVDQTLEAYAAARQAR